MRSGGTLPTDQFEETKMDDETSHSHRTWLLPNRKRRWIDTTIATLQWGKRLACMRLRTGQVNSLSFLSISLRLPDRRSRTMVCAWHLVLMLCYVRMYLLDIQENTTNNKTKHSIKPKLRVCNCTTIHSPLHFRLTTTKSETTCNLRSLVDSRAHIHAPSSASSSHLFTICSLAHRVKCGLLVSCTRPLARARETKFIIKKHTRLGYVKIAVNTSCAEMTNWKKFGFDSASSSALQYAASTWHDMLDSWIRWYERGKERPQWNTYMLNRRMSTGYGPRAKDENESLWNWQFIYTWGMTAVATAVPIQNVVYGSDRLAVAFVWSLGIRYLINSNNTPKNAITESKPHRQYSTLPEMT